MNSIERSTLQAKVVSLEALLVSLIAEGQFHAAFPNAYRQIVYTDTDPRRVENRIDLRIGGNALLSSLHEE